MRFSALALVATIVSVATASMLPFSVRQVVPDDAIGRFQNVGVSGLRCPKVIRHTQTVNEEGVIPHSAMSHNQNKACSEGAMTIFLSSEDAMNAVDAEGSKAFITNFAESGEDAVYGVEKSGRTCGKTEFGPGTVVILFTPAETLLLSNREAFPVGNRYMIIDDPETPGTCTFQAPLRAVETPEPPVPTPAGDGSDADREVPTSTDEDTTGGDGGAPTETDDGSGGGAPPIVGGGRPGGGNGDGDGTTQGGGDGSDGTDQGNGDGSDGEGTGQGDGEGTGQGDGVGTTQDGDAAPSGEPQESPEPESSPLTEDGDGDDDDDGSVCFPADSDVEIEDGTSKKMSEVQIGDRVKVANGIFSDVYMFTHKDANTVHDFVTISTASSAKISATRGHYLYINGRFSAAVSAKVGDVLELGNGARTTIESVVIEKKVGLFNPQTVHGDIIVNSVRASTFTRTIEPQTAQALLAPLRMMYDVIGVSASFLNNGADSVAALLPKGQVSL